MGSWRHFKEHSNYRPKRLGELSPKWLFYYPCIAQIYAQHWAWSNECNFKYEICFQLSRQVFVVYTNESPYVSVLSVVLFCRTRMWWLHCRLTSSNAREFSGLSPSNWHLSRVSHWHLWSCPLDRRTVSWSERANSSKHSPWCEELLLKEGIEIIWPFLLTHSLSFLTFWVLQWHILSGMWTDQMGCCLTECVAGSCLPEPLSPLISSRERPLCTHILTHV